jgi:magnesium-transporting ATPase (P-type)
MIDHSLRNLHINDPASNAPHKFMSNYIKTTKYTVWNFLPLAILFQFKRFANIYFLLMCVLATIKSISPWDPITMIVPTVFVILVSVVREGVEDYMRYRQDKETNSQKVLKIEANGQSKEILSSEVKVGDMLFMPNETFFPCDLILIQSSNVEEGVCFIQTSSLDGEKNLKKRNGPNKFSVKSANNQEIKLDK